MWLKSARDRLRLIHFLAVSACLNIVLVILFLLVMDIGNFKKDLKNDEVVASMVTRKEDEEFIKRVCGDLGIENEVMMIAGPYHVQSFFSPSQNYRLDHLLSRYPIVVDPLDPTRRILIKESIYAELAVEERQAVLAHEIWHINSFLKDGGFALLDTDKEIKANRFVVKYVRPGILIDIYRRYGGDTPEIQALINDLERQL